MLVLPGDFKVIDMSLARGVLSSGDRGRSRFSGRVVGDSGVRAIETRLYDISGECTGLGAGRYML